MNRIHKTERGFASIAAIFLLVVMAALGSFMLTFSNTQQLTSALDLKGSKAYWAARAGLEWGMVSVIRQPPRTVDCPTTDRILTGFDGGFTVTVTCERREYIDGVTKKIFSLTSVANNYPAVAGNVGFTERSVSASIER
jgi:MSHA biogenesis protein MshP